MPRPPGLETGEFYFGHKHPAGITICGADSLYMFLLTPGTPEEWIDESEWRSRLYDLMEPFGGTVKWLRDNMDRAYDINYRPLEAAIQPMPWHNGRIVLVGDSAHATTPHLASGAGMAVEGAVVLGEELAVAGRSVAEALAAYETRRYDRCKQIVDTSVEVSRLQQSHGSPEQIGRLMDRALRSFAEPF